MNAKGELEINTKDEIIKGACITTGGNVVSPIILKSI